MHDRIIAARGGPGQTTPAVSRSRGVTVPIPAPRRETRHLARAAAGLDRLGPWPAICVATLRDLGLTDPEIARYFGVSPETVRLARAASGPAS